MKATLDAGEVKKADGFDDLYAVDLNDHAYSATCAVLENDNAIKNFLGKVKGITVSTFTVGAPETKTIVVGNYDFAALDAGNN